MANESIAFDVELKTAKAATGVQSLRTELKNLRNQLATLDAGSAEFSKIAAKAGAVQDKIGDLKETIAAFHPERKFQAFSGAIQGVAGGFAAAQGAMALFGSESEDLQKTLIKVQGAMALSQGLNSVLEMGNAFTILGAKAKLAFATVRAGMISTGIGALIVALGTVVAYWDEIKSFVGGVSAEQNKLNTATEKDLKQQKEKLQSIGDQDNILKLQGKSEKYILGIKIAQTEENIETIRTSILNQEVTKNMQVAAAKRNKEILEGMLLFLSLPLTALLKGIDLISTSLGRESTLMKDFQDTVSGYVFDPEKVEEEGNAVIEASKTTLKQVENQYAGFKLSVQDIDKAAKKESEKTAAEKIDEDIKNQKRYFDFLVSSKESEKALWDKSVEDFIAAEDEKFKRLKGFRDAEAQYDDLMLEKKKNNLSDITSLLTSFSSMAGAQSEEGKALAIAGALIDTYSAAWSIFESSAKTEGNPYTPWLHASAAIVGGLVNVQKIMSVNAQGQTSSGGGNTSAPPPMTRPQSSRVSFDSGGKPISVSDKSRQRVYVVERDITNAQNRVALIQARAKIG